MNIFTGISQEVIRFDSLLPDLWKVVCGRMRWIFDDDFDILNCRVTLIVCLEHLIEKGTLGLVINRGMNANKSAAGSNIFLESSCLLVVQYKSFSTLRRIGIITTIKHKNIILGKLASICGEFRGRRIIVDAINNIHNDLVSVAHFSDPVTQLLDRLITGWNGSMTKARS